MWLSMMYYQAEETEEVCSHTEAAVDLDDTVDPFEMEGRIDLERRLRLLSLVSPFRPSVEWPGKSSLMWHTI
jgi:hypothetical protein